MLRDPHSVSVLALTAVDTVDPLSQDEATEGTMSSEALPLIFEPLEDATSEGAQADTVATLVPGSARPPDAMPLPELDALETDSDGPSRVPPLLMPDWTSPWQTSGAELLEPISSPGPSVSPRHAGSEQEHHSDRGDAPEQMDEPQHQHDAA